MKKIDIKKVDFTITTLKVSECMLNQAADIVAKIK